MVISSIVISFSSFRSFIVIPNIPLNAKWTQSGVTVAGGHGEGKELNQLYHPEGIFVNDDQSIVIVDWYNGRIVQWKMGDTNGQVIAGGNGQGKELNQLNCPTDVLIDKATNSPIICDQRNRRVVGLSRRSGTPQGEILIDNTNCYGLAMDNQRYLYVSDNEQHEVKRYKMGDQKGTLVAGGHGEGNGVN
jgi:hypothetical protein